MSAIIERTFRDRQCDGHLNCFFCGTENPHSWNVGFAPDGKGVSAFFTPADHMQGYEGILHGGVISALLDCAMTHCLFDIGVQAVTGELKVRFLQPLPCEHELSISAELVLARPPFFRVKSEIRLGGKKMARAEGRFMMRCEGRHG